MKKITDVQKVVKELLEVLASNKVPMRSLGTVLDTLKDEVYSNTVIQKGIAQEVSVQEQHEFVPTDSDGTIYSEKQVSIKCPSN